jgi:EpsD family peptidyl-prolyl cis-trans isomerase
MVEHSMPLISPLILRTRKQALNSIAGIASIVLCALALTSCSGNKEEKKDKAASQTAAKVNKEEITVHQINYVLQQQRNLTPDSAASASRQVLERLIDQELAIQKAQEQKVDRDPKVLQQLEAARREIIARAYAEKIGSGAPKPSPAEVKSYFDSNPALFKERKIYNFQELSIEATSEQIGVLRDALKSSKDINEFVRFLNANNYRFGAGQTSRAAEQLPLARLGEFANMKDGQAVFTAAPRGAQVTILASSRLQGVDEERARPAIEQFLLNERKRKVVDDDLKALRTAATVEYVGEYADGAPKSMEEKLSVTPSKSPLVTSPASGGEYTPPPPPPWASAPASIAPAEPFVASSPGSKALDKGLQGLK